MDLRHSDEDHNQFLMDMIAEGDTQHHVEEEAAGDASNTDIYTSICVVTELSNPRMMLINKPIILIKMIMYISNISFFYICISNNVDNDYS